MLLIYVWKSEKYASFFLTKSDTLTGMLGFTSIEAYTEL